MTCSRWPAHTQPIQRSYTGPPAAKLRPAIAAAYTEVRTCTKSSTGCGVATNGSNPARPARDTPILYLSVVDYPSGWQIAAPGRTFVPELRKRLKGTPYRAAADYADWLWGETETVFLDVDEEVVADIEWSRENVLELADQWRRARDILDRIGDLTATIETDPGARLRALKNS